MATVSNAINATGNFQINLPGIGSAVAASSISLNSTTGNFSNTTQLVATGSWQALGIGGVTAATAQYIYVKNLDATNYVTLSTNSSGTNPFATLLPGLWTLVPFVASAVYYAEAHTAGCEVQVMVVDA